MSAYSSRRSCSSRVDPSTSVNRNVTVPRGSIVLSFGVITSQCTLPRVDSQPELDAQTRPSVVGDLSRTAPDEKVVASGLEREGSGAVGMDGRHPLRHRASDRVGGVA